MSPRLRLDAHQYSYTVYVENLCSVTYFNGISEAAAPDGPMYGFERLQDTVSWVIGKPGTEIINYIRQSEHDFVG